jgi:hypothetical protein
VEGQKSKFLAERETREDPGITTQQIENPVVWVSITLALGTIFEEQLY